MTKKVKIDIVSDVVCPWCIIGYKQLEKAITEMGVQDKFEIEWQPFELNPDMPAEGENVTEHITRKYGTSAEDNKRSKERMTALGEELGFKFDYFDEMRIVNTTDAHILIDYAKEKDKQTALNLCLMELFFSERKDVSDQEILLQAIKRVGLDADDAKAILKSKTSREDIKTKERHWTRLGINSVPTMVFNMKSALTGAQPVEVYKQVLTELINTP